MIAPRILLTAAHCAQGTTASSWTAYTYRLTLYTDTPQDILYNVQRIYVHPQFDSNTMVNDVAIFILGEPGTNDGTYQPAFVKLNRDDATPAQGDATRAIGWGTTSSGGSISQTLLQVDLPALSTSSCMSAGYGSQVNYPSMVCAGETGKDTCQGDSGGPLFVQKNGEYYQIGITSWGYGCGTYPGVYSRVSNLVGWIDGIVNSEGGYANGTTYTTVPGQPTQTRTSTTTTRTVTRATQTYWTSTVCATPMAAIPDLGQANSEVSVAAGAAKLMDLKVTFRFNHSYPRDMTGTLYRNSDGTNIRLFSRQFCTTPKKLEITFDDNAVAADYDCANGGDSATILPKVALSTFAGSSPSGSWRLQVTDDLAVDSGLLMSWCIRMSFLGQQPTTTVTLPPTPTATIEPTPTIPTDCPPVPTNCPEIPPDVVVITETTTETTTATVTATRTATSVSISLSTITKTATATVNVPAPYPVTVTKSATVIAYVTLTKSATPVTKTATVVSLKTSTSFRTLTRTVLKAPGPVKTTTKGVRRALGGHALNLEIENV